MKADAVEARSFELRHPNPYKIALAFGNPDPVFHFRAMPDGSQSAPATHVWLEVRCLDRLIGPIAYLPVGTELEPFAKNWLCTWVPEPPPPTPRRGIAWHIIQALRSWYEWGA